LYALLAAAQDEVVRVKSQSLHIAKNVAKPKVRLVEKELTMDGKLCVVSLQEAEAARGVQLQLSEKTVANLELEISDASLDATKRARDVELDRQEQAFTLQGSVEVLQQVIAHNKKGADAAVRLRSAQEEQINSLCEALASSNKRLKNLALQHGVALASAQHDAKQAQAVSDAATVTVENLEVYLAEKVRENEHLKEKTKALSFRVYETTNTLGNLRHNMANLTARFCDRSRASVDFSAPGDPLTQRMLHPETPVLDTNQHKHK